MNQVSNHTNQVENGVLVPKNAQDLQHLKDKVDSLVQKSAENMQQQLDETTKPK